ncbi:hypothetical protein Tco_0401194 [Tanacetum coccineum]
MPDTTTISDSEDTNSAHLPKIKLRSEGKQGTSEDGDWDHSSHGFAKELGRRSSMKECHRMLTDQVVLVNPEGHRLVLDDLEYLVSGDKGRRSTLSISKLKAAQYLDFGLEELVPSLWIESEREYDISAAYEDYTIVSKPRAVIYKDRNDQKKMMRETEVHKFSDDTLQRILDKLDHIVKDFKLYKYNKGMETRIWSEDDRRRSKDFMGVIERRLKIRRIFRSLKIFVGGRLRDVDYRLIQRTERIHPSDTQIPCSSGVYFITACSYSIDTSKELMKSSSICFKASATLISKSSQNDQVLKLKELQERRIIKLSSSRKGDFGSGSLLGGIFSKITE